jgi:hypothetical protein
MTKEIESGSKSLPRTVRGIKREEFKNHFYIESFGVRIGFSTNSAEALEAVRKAVEIYLPDRFTEIPATRIEHDFWYLRQKNERDALYRNGTEVFSREPRRTSVEKAASRIRLTVAEFAARHVFIHAGVVAWKNRAVVLPGKSFRGKTALTVALIERGALYYSDEFAILDADGLLHPFPKMLSVRGEINEYKQIDHPVEHLGGVAGTEKIEVGMVLISEYKPSARWNPKTLTAARGMIELISNSVSIRRNPEFTLGVLNRIANRAKFVKSNRGDVSKSADQILNFIDSNL